MFLSSVGDGASRDFASSVPCDLLVALAPRAFKIVKLDLPPPWLAIRQMRLQVVIIGEKAGMPGTFDTFIRPFLIIGTLPVASLRFIGTRRAFNPVAIASVNPCRKLLVDEVREQPAPMMQTKRKTDRGFRSRRSCFTPVMPPEFTISG